jgi:hypothetical protein
MQLITAVTFLTLIGGALAQGVGWQCSNHTVPSLSTSCSVWGVLDASALIDLPSASALAVAGNSTNATVLLRQTGT